MDENVFWKHFVKDLQMNYFILNSNPPLYTKWVFQDLHWNHEQFKPLSLYCFFYLYIHIYGTVSFVV